MKQAIQKIKSSIGSFLNEHPIIAYFQLVFILLFSVFQLAPAQSEWTKVSILLPVFAGLAPLYWELIKIRKNLVTPVSLQSQLDPINDKLVAYPDDYAYAVIKKAGIHKIMFSYGHLREIRIVDGPIGEVAVYDGDDENRQEIVPPCSPDKGQVLKKDCMINTGLVIVTASDTKIVISYRQR